MGLLKNIEIAINEEDKKYGVPEGYPEAPPEDVAWWSARGYINPENEIRSDQPVVSVAGQARSEGKNTPVATRYPSGHPYKAGVDHARNFAEGYTRRTGKLSDNDRSIISIYDMRLEPSQRVVPDTVWLDPLPEGTTSSSFYKEHGFYPFEQDGKLWHQRSPVLEWLSTLPERRQEQIWDTLLDTQEKREEDVARRIGMLKSQLEELRKAGAPTKVRRRIEDEIFDLHVKNFGDFGQYTAEDPKYLPSVGPFMDENWDGDEAIRVYSPGHFFRKHGFRTHPLSKELVDYMKKQGMAAVSSTDSLSNDDRTAREFMVLDPGILKKIDEISAVDGKWTPEDLKKMVQYGSYDAIKELQQMGVPVDLPSDERLKNIVIGYRVEPYISNEEKMINKGLTRRRWY